MPAMHRGAVPGVRDGHAGDASDAPAGITSADRTWHAPCEGRM